MSHYGYSMSPETLLKWAPKAAATLSDYAGYIDKSPMLVYQGMSGVAHATALSMELQRLGVKFFLTYVRKPGEETHGGRVEFTHFVRYDRKQRIFFANINSDNILPVFVDDFIVSGSTFKAVRTTLESDQSDSGRLTWPITEWVCFLTEHWFEAGDIGKYSEYQSQLSVHSY